MGLKRRLLPIPVVSTQGLVMSSGANLHRLVIECRVHQSIQLVVCHQTEHHLARVFDAAQNLQVAGIFSGPANAVHQHSDARRHDFSGQQDLAQRLDRGVRVLGKIHVDGRLGLEHVAVVRLVHPLDHIRNRHRIDDLGAQRRRSSIALSMTALTFP